MKKLIAAFAVVLTFAATAEKPPFDLKQKPQTEEEKQARIAWFKKQQMIHTGGFITKPGSQQGEVVYLNCQKRAQVAWMEESAEYFRKESKFKITVKDGGTFNLANPKVEGNATLFVVDDPALPPVLLAPESRWAMVNVAGLSEGNGAKPAFFEARVKKSLTRGFALLCGASNSQYPMCLTGAITKPSDMDVMADLRLQADVIERFKTYMAPFGVRPAQVLTYRKACQEGWAAQPTNDYQKAVWEQVHKLPEKPIKIEFDPKTDKK